MLRRNTKFTHVNLSRNSLSKRGIQILCKALERNETIIHLNLSSNDMPAAGAKRLFHTMMKNCTIISLDISSSEGLNRNRIGSAAKQLAEVLKTNVSIQFLNVSGNTLGATGFDLLLDGLCCNQDILTFQAAGSVELEYRMGSKSTTFVVNITD